MPKIICKYCGQPVDLYKYRITALSFEFLEEYLSSYFEINLRDVMCSISKAKEVSRIRSLCGYMIYKYSGATSAEVAERFSIAGYRGVLEMRGVKNLSKKDPDFVELDKVFSLELGFSPER